MYWWPLLLANARLNKIFYGSKKQQQKNNIFVKIWNKIFSVFEIFLHFFYVLSIYFLSFFSMLCHSVFCRVYVMSGLGFVFLCFVMNPFANISALTIFAYISALNFLLHSYKYFASFSIVCSFKIGIFIF